MTLLTGDGDGLIGQIVDKIAPNKVSKAELMQIEGAIQDKLAERLHSSDNQLHQFFLDYEGRAADQHWIIMVIRGLIRPIVTIWAFYMATWGARKYLGITDFNQAEQFLTVLKWIFGLNIITLTFWFGPRALKASGLVEVLTKKLGK